MKPSDPATFPAMSRRLFLKSAASGAILLLVGCRLNEPASPGTGEEAAEQPDEQAVGARRARETVITPVGSFYRQQFQGVPRVDAVGWALTIDGLVQHPTRLSLDEVRALPRVEMMRTLECIGNPVGGNQIGNAVWAGFLLEELLADVGVLPEAVRVRFEAADGYETSAQRHLVDRPGVLMAYEMNGEPLTADHGFPLRIFMPGLYGQKMAKWVTRMEFIADDSHRGYWERQGWSDIARVKTNSQIMEPLRSGRLPLSEIEVYGVAYAGDRRITGVEVGIEQDGAVTWSPAELVAGPSAEVWTQFYYLWTPPAATRYTILVRATDEDGFVQTERAGGILQGAYPDGTDKIHSVGIRAG